MSGIFCERCKKSFSNVNGLSRHMGKLGCKAFLSTSGFPVCDVCSRQFKSIFARNRHALVCEAASIELLSDSLVCKHCGMKCVGLRGLTNHQRRCKRIIERNRGISNPVVVAVCSCKFSCVSALAFANHVRYTCVFAGISQEQLIHKLNDDNRFRCVWCQNVTVVYCQLNLFDDRYLSSRYLGLGLNVAGSEGPRRTDIVAVPASMGRAEWNELFLARFCLVSVLTVNEV
jgi:hypothetical protein